jgi:prevent-host-death family protein
MSQVIAATEFKAKCLALLDQVDQQGDTIIVTERGRPVATLKPVKQKRWKSPRGSWIGKVEIVGDIVNTDRSDLWEALREPARTAGLV